MSAVLPLEAKPYIDATSFSQSLRNLAEAVEQGVISASVVAAYARYAENGAELRFSKTRSIPLLMKEMIEANPDLPARQVIYKGFNEGLWSWDDVANYEANSATLSQTRKKPAARGVYLTRNRRSRPMLPNTGSMFVPKMALDAVCSRDVSDGAKACLALLMTLCGKAGVVTTYTSSIATTLGRTTRSVRNYFQQLESAGLITRIPGKQHNTVKITVTDLCRPEPYKEPADVRAFKLARKSQNPAIRDMADAVVLASCRVHRAEFGQETWRKEISAFNPESESYAPFEPEVRPKSVMRAVSLSAPTSHSKLYRPIRTADSSLKRHSHSRNPTSSRMPSIDSYGSGRREDHFQSHPLSQGAERGC